MKDDPLNRNRVKRGEDLPQSKLSESDVRAIREIVEYREKLKSELKSLTNESLADKFEVHIRTIDKVTAGYTWGHV